MADVLAFRLKQRPVRTAAAVSTITVSIFYLLAQMVGAGALVALLLVAEFLRNSGRYTMADVLAFRMRQRPVRTAASVSTIVVSIFYLIAQTTLRRASLDEGTV